MKRFLVPTEGQADKKAKTDGGKEGASRGLHVVTYNVDGLNETALHPRTTRVVDILVNDQGDDKPDVIMLQEVIQETAPVLISGLLEAGYVCCPPELPDAPYFTLLLVNPERIKNIKSQHRHRFPGSKMDRDLIEVVATIDDKVDACFLTSHLESLKNSSGERCRQLNTVLDKLTAFKGVAIFGGDTNLREAEVSKQSRYSSVTDCWVAGGRPADKQYTWDLQLNTNLQMPGPSQPRMRLDRLLCSKSIKGISVTGFDLLGTAKIPLMDVFPSDHFGLSCHLRIPA